VPRLHVQAVGVRVVDRAAHLRTNSHRWRGAEATEVRGMALVVAIGARLTPFVAARVAAPATKWLASD
jgi:hypothetical protein